MVQSTPKKETSRATKSFKLPNYLTGVDAYMTRSGSPLHDFPFTDSLMYDQQFEVDQQGTLTGGIIRTNRSPTRLELNSIDNAFNVYEDGILRASLVSDQLRFLNTSGVLNSTILASSSGDTIFANVQDGTDIIIRTTNDPLSKIVLDSPLVEVTGDMSVAGIFAGDGILAGSHIAVVDGIAAPTAIVGLAQIYVDIADGDLKVRFGDGTTKTIATNP